MTETPGSGSLPSSLEAARRHDQICDRFEMAWRAGNPPRIEDLLLEVPDAERADLLAMLIRLEREFRSLGADIEEYQRRFPDYKHILDTLFRDPSGETPFTGKIDIQPPIMTPNIPGYDVDGLLGTGGMGLVFKGRHKGLDLPVAVKMIRSGAWSRPEDLVRFQLEARAVAGLNHSNVVRVYDYGQHDGLPYLVMELIEGGPLSKRLADGPLEALAAAALSESMARAAQHFHDRGIVHRDLKPGNILMTLDGSPKITDFGLAKHLLGTDPSPTLSKAVLGTASYMPPEQAAGKAKGVGPPADVYSLGAILFEMLTGRPPFRAETYHETAMQVIHNAPPRPIDLVPGIPADLEAVCLKCLEKDPVDRYPTALDLAEDLRRFQDGLAVSARTVPLIDRDTKWAKKVGYENLELIGCSRWACIYSAKQVNISRSVLLKLSAGKVGSRQHAAIRRQGEAIAGLSHTNVLQLYDYGEEFGQPYLVLEHVEGGTILSKHLRQAVVQAHDSGVGIGIAPVQLSLRVLVEIARDLAQGLQAIHEHGVTLAGLHPNEILLTRSGNPKIGGFSQARRAGTLADDPSLPPLDPTRMHYAAPELVVNDPSQIGPLADIYALGAIIYDMMTGRPPFFNTRTPMETREAILTRVPEPPSTFRQPDKSDPAQVSSLLDVLDDLCTKCLRKDPNRRYHTAAQIAKELKEFLVRMEYLKLKDGDVTIGIDDSDGNKTENVVYQLRIISGPERVGSAFRLLPRDQTSWRIGRSAECDLTLASSVVSRVHFGISWNHETRRHELLDYGSKNGTLVNGERVKGGRALNPGDTIRIPEYEMVFELRPAEASA